MNITEGVKGHIVKLTTSNPLHFSDRPATPRDDDVAGSFSEALAKALGKVNDLQVDAEELEQRMIHSPESVDIHTVMIAMQKAEIAMTLAKSVRDEAIRTYRELMNLR
jgi:flagellar hook-basal body complex protein FliE